MRIWIYLNGIQQGPYTLDEISAMNILPSTPVWYEGISQWLPASEAPATAVLFNTGESAQTFSQRQQPPKAHNQAYNTNDTEMPPCPPTHMAWAIIVTLCCCLPGGILAIIFAAMTTNAYNRGDYKTAVKMSTNAEWAIMISIVLGLIFTPVSFLFM